MTSADRGDDQDFSKFADIQYKEDEGVKIPKIQWTSYMEDPKWGIVTVLLFGRIGAALRKRERAPSLRS